MANNKVVLGNEVLIDLTDSTVNPNVLLAGYKAYDASGNAITGEFSPSYHITLTQAQYDQLSQTEKMADENFFYITDAVVVGADIDDTTTSTTKVWSSSKTNAELSAKANSADVPTKAQITNPNLLDNPWFTVNQRGFASGSYNNETKYTVDRWKVQYGIGSVSLGSNGLTIEPTSSGNTFLFRQQLDIASLMPYILGKTVTLSIMLSDGSVYSATDTLPASLTSSYEYKCFVRPTGDNVNVVVLQMSSTDCCVQYYNDNGALPTSAITLRAVKLELGSISTLALDTAPNYATELAKCQRYYQRLENKGNDTFVGIAYSSTANYVRTKIPYTVSMRTTPSLILTGKMCVWGLNYGIDLTSISGGWYQSDNNGLSLSIGNTTGTTVGSFYYCMLPTNSVLELTADL